MWCRPEPSSVSPIYMPGRLRTASRPRSTLIDCALYSPSSGGSTGSLINHCPCASARRDDGIGHAEKLSCSLELGEERRIGAGEPSLAAERDDLAEQRGTALAVEMCSHFIEQHHPRRAAQLSLEPSLRHQHPDDQRLLLAGRAFRRGHSGAGMAHAEIGAMRPDRGDAALGVDPARRVEAAAELVLGGERRHRLEPILDGAREREPPPREGPARLAG